MTPFSRTPDDGAGEADVSAAPAARFIRGLLWLRRLVGQYPSGHPLIGEKVSELHALVLGELSRTAELHIDMVNGSLLVDGAPVDFDPALAQGIQPLADLGIHSVQLRRGLRPDEILATAEFLWDYEEHASTEPVRDRLAARDVQHLGLAAIVPLDTRWHVREWPDAPQGPIDPDYEQALLLAQGTFDDVLAGRDIDRVTVRDLVQLLIQRVARSNAALGQILAVKQYENLTYAHSVNVSMLSLIIGRSIGLDEPSIEALVEASLLHDIGKTRIPLDILRKPGALTAAERRQIELHAPFGAEILAGVAGLDPLTPTIALEHHRTVVGGGYPDLGAGVIPHAMSQIVSVADTYEAITGARTYKDPTPPERACLILARVAGEQLNASLVKAFVNTITFFPVGSFVRTSLDELAVVVRTTENDPLHPVIAVLDPELAGIRDVVDTSERDAGGEHRRHVVETLSPPANAPDLTQLLDHAPSD